MTDAISSVAARASSSIDLVAREGADRLSAAGMDGLAASNGLGTSGSAAHQVSATNGPSPSLGHEVLDKVRGISESLRSQFQKILVEPVPEIKSTGNMVKDFQNTAAQTLRMQRELIQFQLTLSVADAAKSIPKKIVDQALQMKD